MKHEEKFLRRFVEMAVYQLFSHSSFVICHLTMVRLKDIAQLTGVSVMTVSKALRDEPDVSAATKAKIKSLALQMGYVPDSSAQGLRTRPPSCSAWSFLPPPIPFMPAWFMPLRNGLRTRLRRADRPNARTSPSARSLPAPPVVTPRGRTVPHAGLSFRGRGAHLSGNCRHENPGRPARSPAPFCKNFISVEVEELIASYNVTRHLLNSATKKSPISPAHPPPRGRMNV